MSPEMLRGHLVFENPDTGALTVCVAHALSRAISMDIPDLFHLLLGWPIEPAVMLKELPGGSNNRVWLVKTESGQTYVLRLAASAGTVDLARFGYEAALLAALRDTSLPFALPLLLPTRSGETCILVEQEEAAPAVATLAPFLAGKLSERTAVNVARAGIALAQLDTVLAAIPAHTLPVRSSAAPFQYGALWHCHPLVPNPFTAVERVLEPEQARLLCGILRQVQEDWVVLCSRNLPRQILHRDCGPGNVLMDQDGVTAILDFEFAGLDHRVFDLCVAISWWPVRVMGTGREWELIDAFGQAYAACLPLNEEELRILPAALRMRDITSLIYHIGRFLAGLEARETIQKYAQHSLWREAWLVANGETLLRHGMAWNAVTSSRAAALSRHALL